MESIHTEKNVKKDTMKNSHRQRTMQWRLRHKPLDFGNGGRSAS